MRAAEREPVLELLELAFGERELFARYMDADPDYDPGDFLLALEGVRPVAAVQLFARTIRLRGEPVLLGGIGSVSSHPDYRGRGLVLELLRRQETRMRARGMALGMLFSTLHDFYGKLGWVAIDTHQVALHRRLASAPASTAVLRPFRDADHAALRGLYDAYCAEIDGTTVRDPRYWSGQLRTAGNPDERILVAERGGTLVAYARAIRLEGVPIATEFAGAPGETATLAELLLALAPDEGALLVRLPPGGALDRALAARAGAVDPVPDRSMMWRALDRPALARLARLPETSDDATLLRALIERPPVHYWVADRF